VPRFYLDIVDGEAVIEDPEGVDFPDLATALAEAELGARELVAHGIMRNEDVSGQSFMIRDDTGPLATVRFREMLPGSLKRGRGSDGEQQVIQPP
jgi:hypothetical protein